MFMTPREAVLQAENDRLKAENAYLRRALEPGTTVTPIAVVEEMTMRSFAPDEIRLPIAASIKGNLARDARYHVVARLRFAAPEDLEVRYYADGAAIKGASDYAVNNLLPMLHENFVRALADALSRNR